jgi:hypothetical protein
MPNSCQLIPRNRLRRIPPELRLAHEYCFFLHDQCARLLVEYEAAKAQTVTINFRDEAESKRFAEVAKQDSISALREIGRLDEARRVVLNAITMAMVSDCLHHIYEALRCLEKRKSIVALNLLRKPLMDSLIHLSWMLGDESAFYEAFTSGEPEALATKKLGNHRAKIIQDALLQTQIGGVIDAAFVRTMIFDRTYAHGLQKLLQHAVHLITVDYPELKTSPENFNFIFKRPDENDIYHSLYENLPPLFFYLSHVILELFDRITPMDAGAKTAFVVRSLYALHLLDGGEATTDTCNRMEKAFGTTTHCPDCKVPFRFTVHNAARTLLTESVRCAKCRVVHGFPFAWLF